MFEHMMDGFSAAFSLANLASLLLGSFVGVVVGILPGLGPMVGMVVLLPFTFSFTPDIALSLLLGYFAAGISEGPSRRCSCVPRGCRLPWSPVLTGIP